MEPVMRELNPSSRNAGDERTDWTSQIMIKSVKVCNEGMYAYEQF